jgi:hypothetical protein
MRRQVRRAHGEQYARLDAFAHAHQHRSGPAHGGAEQFAHVRVVPARRLRRLGQRQQRGLQRVPDPLHHEALRVGSTTRMRYSRSVSGIVPQRAISPIERWQPKQ